MYQLIIRISSEKCIWVNIPDYSQTQGAAGGPWHKQQCPVPTHPSSEHLIEINKKWGGRDQ